MKTPTPQTLNPAVPDPRLLIKLKRLPHGAGLALPRYQKDGDAGFDLCAATSGELEVGERVLVPTGFSIELPPDYSLWVLTRSGLALKQGLVVLNSPGLVDSGYRGELALIMINMGFELFSWNVGDRIAQGVLMHTPQARIEEWSDLSSTERGGGGFGSTGTMSKGAHLGS
jgi:dUTP pyrophosphatase